MENRLENMKKAMVQIDKDFGKGTLVKLGDAPVQKLDIISTGSIALDYATGVWGFPKGRIIEVYGPEQAGKTHIMLHAIAQCQKKGGVCAFIDAEHGLSVERAAQIGVDINNLYINQPDCGEVALEIVDQLVSSRAADLICIDSVSALVPRAEIEGDMGDAQMALQARLMSQAMRKLTGIISKSNTCVIFSNQLRMKLGGYGNPETTTGGNALKFYASIRLDVRKGEILKDGETVIGHMMNVKVVKNKVAPPYKKAEIEFYLDRGIDNYSSVLSMSVNNNLVQKSGTWFAYNEERLGQGTANVVAYFKENPKIFNEIETKLKTILGYPTDGVIEAIEPPDEEPEEMPEEIKEEVEEKDEKVQEKRRGRPKKTS